MLTPVLRNDSGGRASPSSLVVTSPSPRTFSPEVDGEREQKLRGPRWSQKWGIGNQRIMTRRALALEMQTDSGERRCLEANTDPQAEREAGKLAVECLPAFRAGLRYAQSPATSRPTSRQSVRRTTAELTSIIHYG